MEHLVALDDLGEGDLDDIVRLGVLVHDRPAAVGRALEGRTVALVLPPPRFASAKVRLRNAVDRLGARAIDVDVDGRGERLDGPSVAGAHVVVVAGPDAAAIRRMAEQLRVPVFNAGQGPGDPWSLLADRVAARLAAAHHERAAVDGPEELRREAMVPTAAAAIALLAGCRDLVHPPRVDLRTESASHWFG